MDNKPLIVSISAISGGGKTTVTKALSNYFQKAIAFYFDDYEYTKQPENIGCWIDKGSNPDEWDLSFFEKDINNSVHSGDYDYIFFDYPFGKKEGYTLKTLIDIAFLIDTPLDIALVRRTVRDFSDKNAKEIINELKEYPSVRNYFVYTDDDKKCYDFIVDGNKTVDEIVANIEQRIIESGFKLKA